MCGLAGILLHPYARPAAEWDDIRQLFTQTLMFNEERGREASGVAVVQLDGTCRVFKQPVPASELVTMAGYQEVLAALGAGSTCLLGHTRMPTKGSRWDNANNHPLLAGQVLGIHNGHIHNDDELFGDLGLPRRGQVDSEIIFRLLDTIEPAASGNGHYLAEVKPRLALLRGRFATLSVDLDQPARLLVSKHDMPLCLHYQAAWQAICFSSRYLFLRKAFGRSVLTEALDTERIYLYDARLLPDRGICPVDQMELE